MIEDVDDCGCFFGAGEVSEGEAAEDAVVEVVVEGVWEGEGEVGHEGDELFFFHGEGDVFDYDCRGD